MDHGQLSNALEYLRIDVISEYDTESETTSILRSVNTILAQVAEMPGTKVGYFRMEERVLVAELMKEDPVIIAVPEESPKANVGLTTKQQPALKSFDYESSAGMVSEWDPSRDIIGDDRSAQTAPIKEESTNANSNVDPTITLEIPRKKPGSVLKLTYPRSTISEIMDGPGTTYEKGIAILKQSKLYTRYVLSFRYANLKIEDE